MTLPGESNTVGGMQTMVTVGTDKIWAEDSGGVRPVLVLLHEGVGDSRMWDPVWPELTAACRVIRYDVRGYGLSPAATQDYTLLADLRAVLDHFGVSGAHFAGCSMGGGTAVEFALLEPDRVESLVLLCPGFTGFAAPEEPELEAEFEALVAAGDEDGLVDLIVRLWGAAGTTPFVAELARSAARAGANEERFQQPGEPTFHRLGEIRVPTVIMVGDLDQPTLIDSNEQAAERIPGCRLIWMPGVDHYPTARVPALVVETILSQVRGGALPPE
jgi:3-oxoadipate enol-lactonase